MDLSPDFMLKVLSKKTEGGLIGSVESVEVESGVGNQQSTIGEVFRVKVKALLVTGKRKTFKLIVKNGEEGDSVQQFQINKQYYTTEIKAYKILERLKHLASHHKITSNMIWADCLYASCDSSSFTIVLQDLCEIGYNVFHGQLIDKHHALIAVESLARVHAMSRLLMNTESVDMESMRLNKIIFLKDYFSNGLTVLAKAVCIWKEEWKYIRDYLLNLSNRVVDIYTQLYTELENEFTVLNLGDCWTSNMMFTYSETTLSPTSVKFIDFQFAHLNSFVWDLNYLLHVSLLPFLRLEIYELCLSKYQEKFTKTLEEMNGDPSLAPTYEQVNSLMDKLLLLGFLFSTISTTELISGKENDDKDNTTADSSIKLEWFLKNSVQNGYIKNIEYFESKGLFKIEN